MQTQYDYLPPLDDLACRERSLTIEARELLVGDTVFADGFISFEITAVRDDVWGFVSADYLCGSMAGTRVFADTQQITVRRLPAGSH